MISQKEEANGSSHLPAEKQLPSHPDSSPIPVKLFVSRVPPSVDEAGVRSVFEKVGLVLDCSILHDKETHEHKNSAFVKMASLTQADEAVRRFHNNHKLPGANGAIQVRYAIGEVERLALSADCQQPGQDEATVFVGSIPRKIAADEVKALFEPYGKINTVFILKDQGTGESKGCGFVKFAFKEQAIQAMQALNQKHTLEGASRPLDVRFAVGKNNPKKFPTATDNNFGRPSVMGGEPQSTAMFIASPPQPLASVSPGIPPHTQPVFGHAQQSWPQPPPAVPVQINNSNPRSAGSWKEYASNDGIVYYHNSSTGVTTWSRPPEFDVLSSPHIVQYSQPVPQPIQVVSYHAPQNLHARTTAPVVSATGPSSDRTGPPGANLFLFHIPNNWREDDLVSNFQTFGRIVNARVPLDQKSETGSNKGFAFLSFDSVNSAVKAIAQMNGFMVAGKRLKVAVKKGEEEHVSHLLKQATSQQMPVGHR